MENRIIEIVMASAKVKTDLCADPSTISTIAACAAMLTRVLQRGQRIYLCGNGGSAADAQHIAAELTGRFAFDRPALSAEALHCNTSYLTAVGNDYGYEFIYERLVKGIGRSGDALIGLSTSGNSANVIRALAAARDLGMETISLTGKNGGNMRDLSDIWIGVPSDATPRIQEAHILIGHILCEFVEEAMFKH
ncbi:MAG: SIS domain-containing protein [Saprospiraceae bacterium]|jgi:D-sedoheptulose 7-phosphate isomerase|nr:SIS domain-containing protein [Saprospiraceae bacterium]MBP9210384.1 SIS domain-containing protein [Saprospiraceae bacterium]MBV6473920.1 Phosphoheptose isomerase [Saprospiraceae bacterium]